jgi:type IV pilus assembly protein PilC
MARFAYTAIETQSAVTRQGTIVSSSAAHAVSELKLRGLAPLSVRITDSSSELGAPTAVQSVAAKLPISPGRIRGGFGVGRSINRKGLVTLTRQLATLVKAGLPVHRALGVLARTERRPGFQRVLGGLASAIHAGGSLSDGLQQQPQVFDRLYINMVKAGEAGGILDTVLDRLARLLERTERIRSRVKAAMTYPVIILLVAGCILAGLGIFVVPKFEQIFQGLLRGQPLPTLTRWVLGAGNLASHHVWPLLGLLLGFWQAWRIFRRTRWGGRLVDRLLIRAPILGDLLLKAAIARVTRTFGSLLGSGVPMLQALAITRETSGNVHLVEAMAFVQAEVRGGAPVARSLDATRVFPPLVTSMIEVGEETGALAEMLTQVADAYDEELDIAIAALTSTIEPIMIVTMALLVGVVVIALFLPIVSIVQHL